LSHCTWNGIKLKIASRNRNKGDMENGLLEFIWRRIHGKDLWDSFIKALKEVKIE